MATVFHLKGFCEFAKILETRRDSLVEPIQLGRLGTWKDSVWVAPTECCKFSRLAVLKPVTRDLQNIYIYIFNDACSVCRTW